MEEGIALVKMSASWHWEATWVVVMLPSCILSRMAWQSNSICFVRSWKTGLAAMCKAAWLSLSHVSDVAAIVHPQMYGEIYISGQCGETRNSLSLSSKKNGVGVAT